MTNKTVHSNSKEIVKGVIFGESCALNLPENGAVCVTAKSKVAGIEALNGELRVTVKTTFSAICQTNGEYEVRESSSESMRSIFSSSITGSTKSVIDASVTDCDVSSGKATATVEISGWILNESELSYLDNEIEGVYCRTEKVEVENVAALKLSSLTLTHSNEARMPLKKILDCANAVSVNNVYPSNGVYQIEGELVTRIAAVTDNNQLINQVFSHPFSTEVPEESCRPDSSLDVDATVCNCDVTLTDGDMRIFVVDTELSFRTAITEKLEIEGVVDCYSKSNETTLANSSATLNRCFCHRSIRDKASSVIKTGGFINEVYCVLSPSVNSSASVNSGVLTVEGLICATVLYADENNNCASATAEIPFLTEIDRDHSCDNHLQPSVNVTNVTARIRTGTEIEVTAEYSVTVRGVAEKNVTLISDVAIGAEKEENDFAISLYIVKPGETLWDVAKALNSDEESLLNMNSDVALPLVGGEKILIYKELNYAI